MRLAVPRSLERNRRERGSQCGGDTAISVITRPLSCQTAEILEWSVSFVLSKYRDSLLWTRTGLRLIWFPGCDPPAASVFVFLAHIRERWRAVS